MAKDFGLDDKTIKEIFKKMKCKWCGKEFRSESTLAVQYVRKEKTLD